MDKTIKIDFTEDELSTLINALEISIPHSQDIRCDAVARAESELREALILFREDLEART